MEESDEQRQWRRDAQDLAALGRELAQTQLARVEVRISKSAAEIAAAAWERDDDQSPLEPEDFEKRVVRSRAAALALIGLAVTEGGRWEADAVYVELPPHLIGAAVDWADIE